MRLIDADVLDKQYKTKIGEWRGDGVLPSMECLMWIAAESMLVDAPTIDAIPVEWLVNLKNEYAREGREQAEGDLMNLLLMWQKEQEART